LAGSLTAVAIFHPIENRCINNDNIKSSEVPSEICIILEQLKSKVFEAPSLEPSQTSTQKADHGSQANVENIN
jgi:hypothetical protein